MDPVYVFLPYIEHVKSMAISFSHDALTLPVPDLIVAYTQQPLLTSCGGIFPCPQYIDPLSVDQC